MNDTLNGQKVMDIEGFPYKMAFSPDSKYLACACESTEIKILQLATLKTFDFIGHLDNCINLAFR